MNFKIIIPNTLTAANLFCGILGILSFLEAQYLLGAVFIGIAAFCDFLDGFVARALNVQGEFGKQMDSLADMISFGLAPGILLYSFFLEVNYIPRFSELFDTGNYLPLFAFLPTIFSAIRLAIFNIDTKQSTGFIGMPTPANTLLTLCIPLLVLIPSSADTFSPILLNNGFLVIFSIVTSFLLVAPIPMIALKFKTFGLKENALKYLLILVILSSSIIWGYLALPVIMICYILLSLVQLIFNPH
jgi:CDP-diacylglycerol--serine O-phosphatidyltransferase